MTFNLNGGQIAGNTSDIMKVIQQGDSVNQTATVQWLSDPVKSDHTFTGWYYIAADRTAIEYTADTPILGVMGTCWFTT